MCTRGPAVSATPCISSALPCPNSAWALSKQRGIEQELPEHASRRDLKCRTDATGSRQCDEPQSSGPHGMPRSCHGRARKGLTDQATFPSDCAPISPTRRQASARSHCTVGWRFRTCCCGLGSREPWRATRWKAVETCTGPKCPIPLRRLASTSSRSSSTLRHLARADVRARPDREGAQCRSFLTPKTSGGSSRENAASEALRPPE